MARQLADTGLPHPVLVDIARRSASVEEARAAALAFGTTLLQPVVNATGVLLHTNLGRAIFPTAQPASYSNLEYDLAAGRRGSRNSHAAGLLARACNAEAAMVVNN